MSCNNDKASGAAESAATEAMDKAGDKMSNAASSAAGAMEKAGDKMTDAAAGAMDKAGDKMTDVANSAAGAMDEAGNKLSEVATNAGNAVASATDKARFGVRDVNFKLDDKTSGLHEKMVAAASNLDIRMKVLEEKMSTTAAGDAKNQMQDQYNKLKEMGDKLQANFDKLGSIEDGNWKKFERQTKVFLKTIDPTI